ncbi:MAG: hypothetical protein IPJ76_16885 [Flavobacteriales bacterium]|nr:MAG: hypothetical protein IPJ76_16885 [Flavobacteriales bacterium]
MKALSTLLFIASGTATIAQCPFDPTITPNNLILCPDDVGVLMTQVYDSYQWYKDGNMITGATSQQLPVSYAQDAGSSFSVEVTDSGCTEMSPSVLVDGWAFIGLTVMTAGDPLHVDSMANFYYCEGDTAILILMPPYDTNIQWYDNNQPIPGATDDTLIVTTTGNYTVSGAPAICPNFNQTLGVVLSYSFYPALPVAIVQNGGQLCVDPPTASLQWYLNGAPINGSTCITPTTSGSYTVTAYYGTECPNYSAPFDFVTSVREDPAAAGLVAWPVPARDELTISSGKPMTGAWQLVDITGRTVRSGQANNVARLRIDLGGASTGRYWFSLQGEKPVAVTVVR